MITAHGSVENAVEAVKLGAFDYLEKPFEQEQIRQVVAKALRTYALARRDARPEEPSRHGRFRLVGQSPAIRQIYGVVEKVADTPSTVLITRRVGHRQGAGRPRAAREFVAARRPVHQDQLRRHPQDADGVASCSATRRAPSPGRSGPSRGASSWPTGDAVPGRDRRNPVEMQVKLLRVLQESEFERVGGIKTIKVDVRLVTATNRDLWREMAAGALPRGPLLPAERGADPHAAPARAARGHPAAGGPFHREVQRAA